jgi:hypothetical protein
MTGTTPLYNAVGPSVFIRDTKTSLIPLLYVPSGAVNNSNIKFSLH